MEQHANLPSEATRDDLTRIKGIAASVAARLNQAGITRYEQLAEKKPAQVARMLSGLIGFSANRIAREDWIGQAARLAALAEPFPSQGSGGSMQQHYSGFTVVLLLEGEQKVRQTRVKHIQSEIEDSWAGWNGQKLIAFFEDRFGYTQYTQEQSEPEMDTKPLHLAAPAREAKPVSAPGTPIQSGEQSAERVMIRSVHLLDRQGELTGIRLPAGRAVNLRLILDTSSLKTQPPVPFESFIYAKQMGQGSSRLIGNAEGSLPKLGKAKLDVAGEALPPGDYRLEVMVILHPGSADQKKSRPIMAISEGYFLNIYTV